MEWVREDSPNDAGDHEDEGEQPSPIAILERVEQRLATLEQIETFISNFFGKIQFMIKERIDENVFRLNIEERSDFEEGPSKGFIIKVLHNQNRPDKFVLADVERKKKRRSGGLLAAASAVNSFLHGDEVYED